MLRKVLTVVGEQPMGHGRRLLQPLVLYQKALEQSEQGSYGHFGRQQLKGLSSSSSSSSSSLELQEKADAPSGESEVPGLSEAALHRRTARQAVQRPLSEIERACRQMLWRRNPAEPIEVTLERSQFPLTAPNLSLLFAQIRSPRDALRLFLCYLRANPSFVPEKALVDALSRFWKHEKERFPAFLAILQDLRKPSFAMTPRRLTTLLRGYGWAGLVEEILQYLSSCEASFGFKPDFVHYSCALHTCIREKGHAIALQIFEQMKKDGKPPTYDTFQALISGFLSIKQAKDAALLFEEMISYQLVSPGQLPCRVVSYVAIVDELLGAQELDCARSFLKNINHMGFVPDYFTCSNVLKAFSPSEQVDEFYNELKAKGLLPDLDSLKRFVNDHNRGGITTETVQLLNALVNASDPSTYVKTPGNDESLEKAPLECPVASASVECPSASVDVVSSSGSGDDGEECTLFDRVLYGLCVYEKIEDAYELFVRMNQHPCNTIMLATSTSMILFDALCWINRWEEAERVLRMMMKWGHAPDPKVYNYWVQGSCKAGHLENVSNFLDEFPQQDLVLDASTHNLVVEKFCMAGKLEEAKKLTKELKNVHGTPDVVSYSRMIQSFAKAGDFDVPRKLLNEMVEMGISPFALPFTPLVQRLCHAGKTDDAVALVDEIERKGCKPLPSQYTLIVSSYCKSRRLQDAFNVMDMMKAKGISPEPQTHKDLFGSCIGTRTLKSAFQAQ